MTPDELFDRAKQIEAELRNLCANPDRIISAEQAARARELYDELVKIDSIFTAAIQPYVDCLIQCIIANDDIASQSATNLSQIGPKAIPRLAEVLKSTSGDAHYHIGCALGGIRDERVIPIIADDWQLNCSACGGRGYTEGSIRSQDSRPSTPHPPEQQQCNRCDNPRMLARLLHRLTRPLRIRRLTQKLKRNDTLYP